MSKSIGYRDMCIQVSDQMKKVAELELEIYRMARQKRWADARTDEGKRIARREFVEAEMKYMDEKEMLDALRSTADVLHRRAMPSMYL